MNVKPKDRTEKVGIRVTPAEKEQLKKLAAAAGLSLTGFIIAECLGEQVGQMILDGFKKDGKSRF